MMPDSLAVTEVGDCQISLGSFRAAIRGHKLERGRSNNWVQHRKSDEYEMILRVLSLSFLF